MGQRVCYVYDGSFEGFLCCVYNFYYNRLKPADIVPMNEYEPSFYQTVEIETDFEQAYKVKFAIEEQMGYENLNFLRECLLSCRKNKEMHMLNYAVKGFSVSVTDYSFSKGSNFKTGAGISGDYFHFGSNSTLHVFEAQVGYDFGFLAVNWFTNIGGNDGRKADGKRAYSSFVCLSAPFRLGGLDWAATVGATPWETSFYNGGSNGFAVSEVSLQAEKAIRISERFSLPLFAKAIWNPATENAFFTVGVNLSVSNAQ